MASGITTKRLGFKLCIGVALTWALLLFLGMMMYRWLDGKLEDQRDDVFQHLVIDHRPLVGKESDPLSTLFMVVNDSSNDISGKHQLICYVNHAVGNWGTSKVAGMWQAFMPDPITGQFVGVFSGGQPESLWEYIKVGDPLTAGGDAATYEHCLSMVYFDTHTECIDLNLIFEYSLESQPLLKQQKEFRLIGRQEGTQFDWHPQPIKSRADFCAGDPFNFKPPPT